MKWSLNQYYAINETNSEISRLVTSLLQSYPLTQACLKILGKALIEKLEFGFFGEGYEIIRQGESGKDIFLCCSEQVDVLVDNKVVVKMDAPILLGDKAIVDPDSKRAATIRIAEGKRSLFLKIPMGLFILDIKNSKTADTDFQKEVEILRNLFDGIQQRLFEYIYLQKNLWEQANSTLYFLNTQMIAKSLDNKKDLKWNSENWNKVKNYLLAEFKYSWPENIEVSHQTFRDVFYSLLNARISRQKFKGDDSEFLVYKVNVWRNWLTNLSDFLIKTLPEDKIPYHIQTLDLFNPRNYNLRMTTLLKKVEKQLESIQLKKEMSLIIQEKSTKKAIPISTFWEGERANEFNLRAYLLSIEKNYEIKSPQRTLVQIARKVAQITAGCENQFNDSVVKLQSFLQKTQNKAPSKKLDDSEPPEVIEQKIMQGVMHLRGVYSDFLTNLGIVTRDHGKITFNPNKVPSFKDLFKQGTTQNKKSETDLALQHITAGYGINQNIPFNFLKSNFYLCETHKDDLLTEQELQRHYWFPVLLKISIFDGAEKIGEVEPGCIVGGSNLGKSEKESGRIANLDLRVDEEQSSFLIVYPQKLFSWELDKAQTLSVFQSVTLPVMSWLLERFQDHLNSLIAKRDYAFQKWYEIDKSITLERKIKYLEGKSVPLSGMQLKKVAVLLKNAINLVLTEEQVFSDQLVKKIYNHILRQMAEDFPEMKLEERSNKAYTQWRILLIQVIEELERIREKRSDGDTEKSAPTPSYEIINSSLNGLFKTYIGQNWRETGENFANEFAFNCREILQELARTDTKKATMLFKQILKIYESHLFQVIIESFEYQKKLDRVTSQRPQMEMEKVKLDLVKKNTEKLIQELQSL